MAAKWLELIDRIARTEEGSTGRYHARLDALPEPYRAAGQGHASLLHVQRRHVTDGDTAITMFSDFTDLWERAVADGDARSRDRRR